MPPSSYPTYIDGGLLVQRGAREVRDRQAGDTRGRIPTESRPNLGEESRPEPRPNLEERRVSDESCAPAGDGRVGKGVLSLRRLGRATAS